VAKLLAVAGRELPWSVWTPLALFWQDALVASLFGAADFALRQKPRLGVGQRLKLIVSTDDEAIGRIRNLQAIYQQEHLALVNWGLWSMDASRIFPKLTGPAIWNQYKYEEGDYAEEVEDRLIPAGPAKAEAAEKPPYDEKAAIELDERLHGIGCPSLYIREAIRAAYCNYEATEAQFPQFAGCPLDDFCERLEGALKFVRRFL